MMAFRFSLSFWPWLLASLKTSFDRLHYVPLFLKLFSSAILGFFFLEICLTIVQGCFWRFLISGSGVVPLVFFFGIGTFFLLLCLFGFKVLRGFRACLVRVLHYFSDFFFPCSALHISMSPNRSSVLRIGSNSTEASGSGRTGGESDSLAVVVHRVALGEPPFPLDKGKGKICEIRYPNGSEYLRAAIQNVEAVGPSRVEPSYGEVFAAWYG